MNKIFLADYVDELVELVERFDYILGSYQAEDNDLVRPARKIEKDLMSYVQKIAVGLEEC